MVHKWRKFIFSSYITEILKIYWKLKRLKERHYYINSIKGIGGYFLFVIYIKIL